MHFGASCGFELDHLQRKLFAPCVEVITPVGNAECHGPILSLRLGLEAYGLPRAHGAYLFLTPNRVV